MRHELLNPNNFENIVVWGCGNYFEKFSERIMYCVTHLIDNTKCGEKRAGLLIEREQILDDLPTERTLIVVSIVAFEEIYERIKAYGDFCAVNILDFIYLLENAKRKADFVPGKYIASIAIMNGVIGKNGERKFVKSQNEIIRANGYDVLQIIPIQYMNRGTLQTGWIVLQNEQFCGLYTIQELVKAVGCVYGIIIHSILYGYRSMDELVRTLENKGNILYYLHDYFCICANKFMRKNNVDCNGYRKSCVTCEDNDKCGSIYQFHKSFFENNDVKLIAPSEVVRKHVTDIYENVDIVVLGHLKYRKTSKKMANKKTIRIAYLGTPNEKKGWNDYLFLADKICNNYELYLLGDGCSESNLYKIKYIKVGQDKEQNELTMVEAMQKYQIDIAYIGSKVRETYSYTYYEAYEAGAFVITTESSGNVAVAVRQNGNGRVFEDIETMADFLNKNVTMFMTQHTVPQITQVVANNEFMDMLLIKTQ